MLCVSSIDGMKAGKDVNYYTHHSTFTSSIDGMIFVPSCDELTMVWLFTKTWRVYVGNRASLPGS